MSSVLSILMSILLGVHAMLGCCWHHAHHRQVEEHLAEHNHDEHSPIDHDHESEGNSDCLFVKCETRNASYAADNFGLVTVSSTIALSLNACIDAGASLSANLCVNGTPVHFLVAMLRC